MGSLFLRPFHDPTPNLKTFGPRCLMTYLHAKRHNSKNIIKVCPVEETGELHFNFHGNIINEKFFQKHFRNVEKS